MVKNERPSILALLKFYVDTEPNSGDIKLHFKPKNSFRLEVPLILD
jgi:hypothetical protein